MLQNWLLKQKNYILSKLRLQKTRSDSVLFKKSLIFFCVVICSHTVCFIILLQYYKLSIISILGLNNVINKQKYLWHKLWLVLYDMLFSNWWKIVFIVYDDFFGMLPSIFKPVFYIVYELLKVNLSHYVNVFTIYLI